MMNNDKPVRACDIVFNAVRTGRGKPALTPLELETRILSRIESESLPLTFLGFVGEYKATMTRIRLACECERTRDITAKQFLNQNSVCPCARSKYDNKYKKAEPVLYVMRSGDIGKIGVTSDILERRRRLNYSNSLQFEIVFSKPFSDKQSAFDAETLIKRQLVKGDFDVEHGRTETFFYNEKTVKSIKNYVEFSQ
ncbi:hypothetical protein CB696_00145 [Salmonella enterica subsp. enterica serovar Livingstone]|nr:hypothetical protein [Salmonella enterica subsp. enterica serovar Livingstone]